MYVFHAAIVQSMHLTMHDPTEPASRKRGGKIQNAAKHKHSLMSHFPLVKSGAMFDKSNRFVDLHLFSGEDH